MLRYRADYRSIAFVTLFYALVAVQWRLGPHPRWLGALLVVVTCVVSWLCAVITHNTIHSPIFRNRTANKIFQVALTCSYGFPVSEYVPGHNLSHHKHTQERADVMRTTKVGFRWNLLNAIAFVPRVAPDVTAANMQWIKRMKATHPRWYKQYLIEAVLSWSAVGVLALIDWRKCLMFFFLPHLFAMWGITAVNYVQHDGCDQSHPVNHSRNFVGGWFNWLTFNNGFHGMHHIEPGLHWSLLPAAHAVQVHPTIHPELEQRSLFVYLFRTFILPGRRLRYDGTPVILPVEGPDADWIPRETRGDLGAEAEAA